jgi:predicted aspartyl protease
VPALVLLASAGMTVAAATPEERPAVAQPSPALVEEVVVSAPEPRYVAPTTRDRIGRIWAPVLINGKGPYRLVLDTGASRSAVTRAVAEDLGVPIRRNAIRLRGATGSATVDAVRVETLEVGDLLIDGTTLPIVGDAFGGAQGVLGGEGLGDKRIVIEFRKDRISIRRSNRERAPAGYSVVPFRFGAHHGMRIEVTVGRLKAVGLIDTGAQVTVGNSALREALMRRRADDLAPTEDIVGVTEDVQQADTLRIPSIVAGELIVRHAPIKFSDLAIFEYWRLDREPALLIGMDVLGVLDTLVIDYRLRELQVRTR